MLPELTGFAWNGTRYYDLTTGRFVKASAVRNALEDVIDTAGVRMNILAEKLQAGKISLADWQRGMMENVKVIHTASGSAANGGWAQMSQADWGAVGQRVREQYDYLRNFAGQIADGTQPLDGRFLVRSDMYADAGRATFEDIRQRAMVADGWEEERRELEAKDGNNCDGCIDQADLGWQPIGTLDPIGDEECMSRCRCNFVYRRQTDNGDYEEIE